MSNWVWTALGVYLVGAAIATHMHEPLEEPEVKQPIEVVKPIRKTTPRQGRFTSE